MISRDGLIFVHNPKAAGQTITLALGGKTPDLATHTPARCVQKGDRFAFGFTRNPWSRMASLYRFLCQKTFRRTDNFDQAAIRAMGFKRWLMDDRFIMQEDLHPTGEPWVMREHWKGEGGADLPPMQRRPQIWWLDGCDFIGRFERLTEDFRQAMRLAGLSAPALGHVNTTSGGDWRTEYDAESRAFVTEHFAPDIARFGYRFEGP